MSKLEFSLNLPTNAEKLMALSENYENLSNYLPDQLKSVKMVHSTYTINKGYPILFLINKHKGQIS